MPIATTSNLAGHLIGGTLRTVAAAATTLAVTVPLDFRPAATAAGWAAIVDLFLLIALAITWMSIACGLLARAPAGANSATLPFQLLPLISIGFARPGSMGAGWSWFAQHQPFTPMIDTLRALLNNTSTGTSAWVGAGWCPVFVVAGATASRALFRRPTRPGL